MLQWIQRQLGRDRRFQGGGMRRSRRLRRTPFYRQYAPAATERLAAIDQRILVSRPNRYIYIRVPKCANSTIVLALGLKERGLDGEYWRNLSAEKRSEFFAGTLKKQTFAHPSGLTDHEAAEAIANYRRILFVRNPFSRVASAYFDKVASGKYERHIGLPKGMPFADFCDYLAAGGLRRNIHWLPQTDIVPFPPESFDFIGYFENLEQDLANLMQLLHGEEQATIPLAAHATQAGTRLAEIYGDAERRAIAGLYAGDFAAFGYDPFHLPG